MGGSSIPRRRGANPPGGAPTYDLAMILPNFAKNCMKLRKFWAIGGRVLGAPPKSATNMISHQTPVVGFSELNVKLFKVYHICEYFGGPGKGLEF